jgi:general stress protein YciG
VEEAFRSVDAGSRYATFTLSPAGRAAVRAALFSAEAKMIDGPPEHKALTCSEAGRQGGQKTKARYGSEHYQRIGQIGGTIARRRHDAEHYRRIGQMGGHAKARNRRIREEEAS